MRRKRKTTQGSLCRPVYDLFKVPLHLKGGWEAFQSYFVVFNELGILWRVYSIMQWIRDFDVKNDNDNNYDNDQMIIKILLLTLKLISVITLILILVMIMMIIMVLLLMMIMIVIIKVTIMANTKVVFLDFIASQQ